MNDSISKNAETLSPAEMGVLELLRESEAMLEGHFLLSSGRHSDKYFQCAKLLQYPDRTAEALTPLAARIKGDIAGGRLSVDAVAGPAMGGIIPAWELGRQLGLRSFFTERNEDGKMSLRRSFEIQQGERILIVEDVITTGKSFGECAALLERLGAEIAAIACIVDRRSADTQTGPPSPWPLYAACKVTANTWEAGSCELCRQNIQAVKPGSRKIK